MPITQSQLFTFLNNFRSYLVSQVNDHVMNHMENKNILKDLSMQLFPNKYSYDMYLNLFADNDGETFENANKYISLYVGHFNALIVSVTQQTGNGIREVEKSIINDEDGDLFKHFQFYFNLSDMVRQYSHHLEHLIDNSPLKQSLNTLISHCKLEIEGLVTYDEELYQNPFLSSYVDFDTLKSTIKFDNGVKIQINQSIRGIEGIILIKNRNFPLNYIFDKDDVILKIINSSDLNTEIYLPYFDYKF